VSHGRTGEFSSSPLQRKDMEFDVQAVDLSGILNKDVVDKAKQMPQPKTYHLLTVLPDVDENYESGLVKAGSTMNYEEVLTPVLFVIDMGPDAYQDKARFPSGPSCKKGDFVIVRPNSGTRIKIHGKEFRVIKDDQVECVVEDPRGIQRAA
jgi:co-chaperonin GroES (HSP10)